MSSAHLPCLLFAGFVLFGLVVILRDRASRPGPGDGEDGFGSADGDAYGCGCGDGEA